MRSEDYRERAVAYRAIGQFRFRQKTELLSRGIDDESPACRGSALISLELLSRDAPGACQLGEAAAPSARLGRRQRSRPAARDRLPEQRLADRDTIVLLDGLADDDRRAQELRETAAKVAAGLQKKARQELGILAARVGVRLEVRLAASLVRDVRVELGRREVCVAEHLLDAAQVGAALEQVRRE